MILLLICEAESLPEHIRHSWQKRQLASQVIPFAKMAGALVTEPFMIQTGKRSRDRRIIERDEGVEAYVVLDEHGVTWAIELLMRLRVAESAEEAAMLGAALGGLLQRQAQEIVYGIQRTAGDANLRHLATLARTSTAKREERRARERASTAAAREQWQARARKVNSYFEEGEPLTERFRSIRRKIPKDVSDKELSTFLAAITTRFSRK